MKLKNIKRKRLNNKGFTLIELLAVVVILAVVMGIAMTSVLSAMNKSRGGSLEDSAITIAQAFNQKYTESLVGGVPDKVYSDVVESSSAFKGYDFQNDAAYYLSVALRNTFNMNYDDYVFAEANTTEGVSQSIDTSSSNKATNITKSFIAFDSNTASFLVCLVPTKTGGYFVDNYKIGNDNNEGNPNGVIFDGDTYEFASDTMFACSNGVTSWSKTSDSTLYTTTT